jgi:hypothetical protein
LSWEQIVFPSRQASYVALEKRSSQFRRTGFDVLTDFLPTPLFYQIELIFFHFSIQK